MDPIMVCKIWVGIRCRSIRVFIIPGTGMQFTGGYPVNWCSQNSLEIGGRGGGGGQDTFA